MAEPVVTSQHLKLRYDRDEDGKIVHSPQNFFSAAIQATCEGEAVDATEMYYRACCHLADQVAGLKAALDERDA